MLFPVTATYEYIIPFNDECYSEMANGRGVRAAENRSKCTIEFTKRILTRRTGLYGYVKYNIIRITGPSETAIKICNKMLELAYPRYINRLDYNPELTVHLFTEEMLPDNTLVDETLKTGPHLDKFGGLKLYTLHNAKTRFPKQTRFAATPWQTYDTMIKGKYYPTNPGTHKIMSHIRPNLIKYQKGLRDVIDRLKKTDNTDEFSKTIGNIENCKNTTEKYHSAVSTGIKPEKIKESKLETEETKESSMRVSLSTARKSSVHSPENSEIDSSVIDKEDMSDNSKKGMDSPIIMEDVNLSLVKKKDSVDLSLLIDEINERKLQSEETTNFDSKIKFD